MPFPMKLKNIPTFEHLKNLKINVFAVSSNDTTLSPRYINKNYYEYQTGLLLYTTHCCLTTDLLGFCRNN